jgi:hypothetical protein
MNQYQISILLLCAIFMITIPATTIFLNYANAIKEDEDNNCVNGGECCNLNVNGKVSPCYKLSSKLNRLFDNIFPDNKAK